MQDARRDRAYGDHKSRSQYHRRFVDAPEIPRDTSTLPKQEQLMLKAFQDAIPSKWVPKNEKKEEKDTAGTETKDGHNREEKNTMVMANDSGKRAEDHDEFDDLTEAEEGELHDSEVDEEDLKRLDKEVQDMLELEAEMLKRGIVSDPLEDTEMLDQELVREIEKLASGIKTKPGEANKEIEKTEVEKSHKPKQIEAVEKVEAKKKLMKTVAGMNAKKRNALLLAGHVHRGAQEEGTCARVRPYTGKPEGKKSEGNKPDNNKTEGNKSDPKPKPK